MAALTTTLDPYKSAMHEGTAMWQAVPSAAKNVFDFGVTLVSPAPRHTSESEEAILDLRNWLGWSDRVIGDAIGVSHVTIGKLARGRSARVDNRQRLVELRNVAWRVFEVADRNQSATDRAMRAQGSDGDSALDWFKRNDRNRAYLAALDALNPTPEGLITTSYRSSQSRTTPLFDED